MSSQPPFNPPGGGAPPPVDPKAQWRVYKEQQRLWKAQQRAARQAQRAALRASRRSLPHAGSLLGPMLLIGSGLVALLIVCGRLNAERFWSWYGHWWPLVLIGSGLLLLAEWAIDLHRQSPSRRHGGFIGLLVLLALLGLGAASWQRLSEHVHSPWNDDGGFFDSLGLPEHNADQPTLSAELPAQAVIEIDNPRGDVNLTASDSNRIEVEAHQVAYAISDAEAQKIFSAEEAHLRVSGNAVLLSSNGSRNGRLNLTVSVPRSARVKINSDKGDLHVASLGAGVEVNAHGDVSLDSITGPATIRLDGERHDLAVHQLKGDLNLSGRCNDLTLSEIDGKSTINGDIFGDAHFERLTGPLALRTSVTELQLAALSGDLSLSSDELQLHEARGPVRLTTRSKDIELDSIAGDSFVTNRNGNVKIVPAGNFAVEVHNDKGDVELTLPASASATVNAHTRNGEILSEFGTPPSDGEEKNFNLRLGSGSARVVLSTQNGDLRLTRGSAFPALSAAPPQSSAQPHTKATPQAHKAPHLKDSSSQKIETVTQ